jgi:hypothetical protein
VSRSTTNAASCPGDDLEDVAQRPLLQGGLWPPAGQLAQHGREGLDLPQRQVQDGVLWPEDASLGEDLGGLGEQHPAGHGAFGLGGVQEGVGLVDGEPGRAGQGSHDVRAELLLVGHRYLRLL